MKKSNKERSLMAGVLVACLGLAGCITSTESVFTEEASPDKALERRVGLARQYIGEGDWENAKRNLELANDVNPNNREVHEAFALVYQSTGEFELAEDHFRRALRLDSGFSRCRNNFAAFLYSRERYEEAEEQLEIVVKDTLYSARPQAFVNLGLSRQRLFDPRGAEEAFVRALSMDRRNRIALLEVAQIRFDAADFSGAQNYYDNYRSVARQQSARGLWLGIQLARATDDSDAEASYVLALSSLYPESAEYRALQRIRQSE